MAYNPYSDIEQIYKAGNDWQNEQDEKKKQTIYQNAQTYYNNLRANGYDSLADELKVSDSNKRKQILDSYQALKTTPTTSDNTTETGLSVDQENKKLLDKYYGEYNDLKNTNPFESETAKAILAKYDLAGLQGRDNETAKEAGSNGGNIDSFAAANALRQQSALVNQGQMTVLEEHQQKLDHARNLLSDMGVHIDRAFTQQENAKNNDVARKSEIASVTGYAPDEWVISNNPYMNDDGTIKDQYKDIDFAAVMANAKAAGNTEAYNAAAQARYYKIMGNYGLYGKWDNGDYIVPGKQRTADYDLTQQQIESAERIATGQNETNLALADKEAASALNQINAQVQGEKEIIQENSKYSTKESDDYVDVVTLQPFNKDEAAKVGVDSCGESAYLGLIDLANTKGGLLTEDEVIDYLVKNSAKHRTNKGQLKHVLTYLGLGTNLLDNVENVSTNPDDWAMGVKYVR